MKVVLALCVALLCVVLVQADEEMTPPILRVGTRVHHGTPAEPGQLPYMAYIRLTDDSGNKSKECAGSLITRLAVLTTAWCVDGHTKYTVRLGSIYRTVYDPKAWTTESTWALKHPEYDPLEWDNNVAIIYLPREAPLNDFIQLVDLPSPDAGSFIGCTGIVSGWGETYPGSEMSDVLRWADEVVIPNDICSKEFEGFLIVVTDRQLCAGCNTSTLWEGDGGAPLVIKTRGRHIVIGIFTGYRPHSDNTSTPILFTRVTSFSDWIKLKTESDQ